MAENMKNIMAEDVAYNLGNGSEAVALDVEQASETQGSRMVSYAEVANKMLEEG